MARGLVPFLHSSCLVVTVVAGLGCRQRAAAQNSTSTESAAPANELVTSAVAFSCVIQNYGVGSETIELHGVDDGVRREYPDRDVALTVRTYEGRVHTSLLDMTPPPGESGLHVGSSTDLSSPNLSVFYKDWRLGVDCKKIM